MIVKVHIADLDGVLLATLYVAETNEEYELLYNSKKHIDIVFSDEIPAYVKANMDVLKEQTK
jgi:hypothetical protein